MRCWFLWTLCAPACANEAGEFETFDVPLVAEGFSLPVQPARAYYDAQPFGRNRHLGEDWNGVGGGATDLGDPVLAIGHGLVVFADDVGGGWGNVVRVVHRYEHGGQLEEVESLYAHLHRIDVSAGDVVMRGEVVGTIGDAHGMYVAHLHLELRQEVGMPIGGGYGPDTTGYLAPSAFIRAHPAP